MRLCWKVGGRMSKFKISRALCISLFLLCFCLSTFAVKVTADDREFNRADFPDEFIFGAGTSSYQVEGAAFEDGRTLSISDSYAHSGYLKDNGDVASDEYHRYKEDVQLMVETGIEAYRLSISWSRLIPNGRGPVNPKGLEYYNNLINELIKHGIQPHVTLNHHDLPLALEDEYGGFSNPRIVEDFTAYADVCFREFGDRVLHWTTINEANLFAYITYNAWRSPRRRYSSNTIGKLTRKFYDPFVLAHHVLLAHASAARLYKKIYLAKQQGVIGINLYNYYFIPISNSTADLLAAERSFTFFIGWFMHPLTFGDYPEMMKRIVGARLPVFTKGELELIKGSSDFIALNYYSINMAKDDPSSDLKKNRDFGDYMQAEWIGPNGTDPLKGDPFFNTPWGLQGVLEHYKQVYDNPPIYIHENGQSTNSSTTTVNDSARVEYLQAHVGGLLESLRNGSNVKGYFAWSFIDVFEYMYGYERSFGLYYIDFNDSKLARYPKLSQKWYSGFLKGGNTIAAGKGSLEDVPNVLRMNAQEVNIERV